MSTTLDSRASAPAPSVAGLIANRYGHFTADGREYCVTDVRTPRPWVNLIANPRVGLAVSQTGGGFSWIDNSQLAVITRWQQEFASDSSGKFLYVRDADSGQIWSLSPAPAWTPHARYTCRHGIGYTTFASEFNGITAEWTLLVPPDDTVELWRVELHNRSDRLRRLEICSFLEWNCGVAPSPRREFHKLFIETRFDPRRRAVFARNHMWEVNSPRFGHWNTSFPYVSAIACTRPVLSAQGDKAAFVGRYGDLRAPEALGRDVWNIHFGRHDDPIAALRSAIELKPDQRLTLGYTLATGQSDDEANRLLERFSSVEVMDHALRDVRAMWDGLLRAHRVETPEASLNFLTNDWIRYQAIAGRIWGRAGYYQQSGAYGFRDQLQDSQVWLTIDPQRCRHQINLHAQHQFADGSVYHWWHPLSEQGHVTKMTDDLLWLAFVSANYIRETGDLTVLSDAQPYLDEAKPRPLLDHVLRAFRRVFSRTSPRGLPYIGAGDWNDGLSAVGLQEKGESVWLGHFLAGLLSEWSEILTRAARNGLLPKTGDDGAAYSASELSNLANDFSARRDKLVKVINDLAWDGEWYIRGTLDDGSLLGSKSNRVGRIFLNAQTWAVLNDVAPPERAARCMQSVREHLVSDAGALLLAPAYDQPVSEVGYITRYAPGLRENGGVYSHAATWAIAAAAKMRDADLLAKLLRAINPALKDPERYWAEPYVLPGNVDGPDSPYHGRGGWTWYTGSAAWLHRVVTHWVLGAQPEWDGLRMNPSLPAGWSSARMTRPWRGCSYEIEIERSLKPGAAAEVWLDDERLAENLIAPPKAAGATHRVRVRCG